MYRHFDMDILQHSIKVRRHFLAVINTFSLTNADKNASELAEIEQGYSLIRSRVGQLPEAILAQQMEEAIRIAVLLCRWVTATFDALPDSQRFLQAAQARVGLLQELGQTLKHYPSTQASMDSWLADLLAVTEVNAVPSLIRALGCIPLPVFYSIYNDPYERVKRNRAGLDVQQEALETKTIETPVLMVLFTLDGMPLTTPQAIRSRVQYDLKAEITVSNWPEDLSLLELDYVSTMEADAYSLTRFSLTEQDIENNACQRGHLRFNISQTLMSEPVVFKVRARFVSADKARVVPATLIGHSEMQVRALDQDSYPILTTYPTVDIQIPKILMEARQALPDISPPDFNDFQKCLVYLARYAGAVSQNGYFKGKKVDEVCDFQAHLLQWLRMTDLGSEVKEGETTAGGKLDLRYRNIIIELKVEDTVKDRAKLREKYVEQPSQYAVASIPLSITCILDMVEKENPPANVANNITLETPALHGFENTAPPYPSKVAVIIIDGNIKSPSAYS